MKILGDNTGVIVLLTTITCFLSSQQIQSQCRTTLAVESREEVFFYASDLISSIQVNPLLASSVLQPAVGLLESLQTGCATFDILGLKISGDTNGPMFSYNFTNNFPSSLPAMGSAIMNFVRDDLGEGIKSALKNSIGEALIPTIVPCNRTPYQTTTHFGGTASLYVAHVGGGPYKKKISKAVFSTCRNVIIENPSTNVIELPIKIQGSVFAAGSFALDEFTFGHARLRAWGNIGGQSFDDNTEVTAADIFPENRDINIVRRFIVAPGLGRFVVPISVNAESLTEVQAKGGGLFGSITASATAGVDFPNSIEVGRFTGLNGAPLPHGVKIYDATAPDSFYELTAPTIEILPRTAFTFPLRIYAPAGSACQLQTSTNLHNWIPLLTTNISDGSFAYTFTNRFDEPKRYFRVASP